MSMVERLNPVGELSEQPPELDTEVGAALTMPFSMEWRGLNELFDDPDQQTPVRALREMLRRDSTVRALYRIICLPIRAALMDAQVRPVDGGEEEAEFIDAMLTLPETQGGMTVTFERFISQTLRALVERYAVFEVVYTMPEVEGPLKGKYTIRKMARRPPETCKVVVDPTGGFAGWHQQTSYMGREVDVVLEPPYVWYYTAHEEENPFYGHSYFQTAYYHFDQKQKLYFLMHLAAQLRAVPGREGTYPKGASKTDRDSFKKALSNFGAAGVITHPEGWLVEEFGNSSAAAFDYVAAIQHHCHEQSKSVLAQFMENLDKTAVVDFSSGHDDQFSMLLQAVMGEIETNLNSYLFPNLIKWNFDSGKYPEFKFAALSDKQKRMLGVIFEKLSVAATENVTPEFMFELERRVAEELGLDIDYDELEGVVQEQRDLEREQAVESARASIETAKATEATSKVTQANPAGDSGPDAKRPGLKAVAASGPILTLDDLQAVVMAGSYHDPDE